MGFSIGNSRSQKRIIRKSSKHTVWKLQNFSVTQILREIKEGESKVSKSAILPHWEALNFDFLNFAFFEGK